MKNLFQMILVVVEGKNKVKGERDEQSKDSQSIVAYTLAGIIALTTTIRTKVRWLYFENKITKADRQVDLITE